MLKCCQTFLFTLQLHTLYHDAVKVILLSLSLKSLYNARVSIHPSRKFFIFREIYYDFLLKKTQPNTINIYVQITRLQISLFHVWFNVFDHSQHATNASRRHMSLKAQRNGCFIHPELEV